MNASANPGRLEPGIRIGEPVLIADGIYRLSLPMRANPGHVNVWLLVDNDSVVLVDTGNFTDESRAMVEAGIATVSGGRGLTRIVLTHAHPDHAGNAQWLAARTGAPVLLADAELDAMNRLWRGSIKHADEVTAFFRRWGIPEDQCPNILGMLKYFRVGCPAIEGTTQALHDNDVLRMAGRNWRVVIGEGHTPANAGLLSEDGWLISGDHVLPTIYPNISVWWGGDANPLKQYLDSLDRYETLPATHVLPSHGPLFSDYIERIADIRRFHHRRLARTLAFCDDGPRSAYDSIAAVLGKPAISPVIALIAGQVLATFAFLEGEGMFQRVGDAPFLFRTTPGARERFAERNVAEESFAGEISDSGDADLPES